MVLCPVHGIPIVLAWESTWLGRGFCSKCSAEYTVTIEKKYNREDQDLNGSSRSDSK